MAVDQNFSKDIDVVQREVLPSADHRVVAVQQGIVVFLVFQFVLNPVSVGIGGHRVGADGSCFQVVWKAVSIVIGVRSIGGSVQVAVSVTRGFLGCVQGTVEEGRIHFGTALAVFLTVADSIVVIIPVDPVQFPVIVVIGAFQGT